MSDRRCPECGLWNTESAKLCDCGFDLSNNQGKMLTSNDTGGSSSDWKSDSSPIMIGIASIIPGLGFYLLGKNKLALTFFLSVFIPIVFILLGASGVIRDFCSQFALWMWVAQIFFSISTAKTQASVEAYYIRQKSQHIYPPSEYSKDERALFIARKLIEAKLSEGDEIEFLFSAFTMPLIVHIGLTKKNIFIVDTDISGEPVNIKVIPRGNVFSSVYYPGIINSSLSIQLIDGNCLDFHIRRKYRNAAKSLVLELLQEKGQIRELGEGIDLWQRIYDKIMITSVDTIFFITLLLFGLIIGIIILMFPIKNGVSLESKLLLGLAFIVSGFSGILFIIKREFPGKGVPIRGTEAVIMGIIWLIINWGLVFLQLIR